MSGFEDWFSGSKVVDAAGDPLVVYHGTFNEFDRFTETADIGFHFGSPHIANKRMDEAAKGRARGDEKFSGYNVRPALLSIKRPLHLSADPGAWNPDYLLKLLDEAIPEAERKRIAVMDAAALAQAQAAAATHAKLRVPGQTRTEWTHSGPKVVLVNRVWGALLSRHRRDVYAQIRAALEREGFDGLTYVNEVEGEGRGRTGRARNPGNLTWVAFRADQIRSAISDGVRYAPVEADEPEEIEYERERA